MWLLVEWAASALVIGGVWCLSLKLYIPAFVLNLASVVLWSSFAVKYDLWGMLTMELSVSVFAVYAIRNHMRR